MTGPSSAPEEEQVVQVEDPTESKTDFAYATHYERALSVSYKAYIRAMSCALVNMLPFPWRARQPRCVLLGRRYDFSDQKDHEAFQADFTSRLLFTYRHGFTPLLTLSHKHSSPRTHKPGNFFGIPSEGSCQSMNRKITAFFRHRQLSNKGLTSDSGWGCMIRVFQMAMAQILMHLHFGRDWRRPAKSTIIPLHRRHLLLNRCRAKFLRSFSQSLEHDWAPTEPEIVAFLLGREDLQTRLNYPWSLVPILTLFRDEPSARFSLHRVVAVGRLALGIREGAWFGPTSCSDSISLLIYGSATLPDLPGNTLANQKQLVVYPRANSDGVRIAVYHSKHGEISRNRVRELFNGRRKKSCIGDQVGDGNGFRRHRPKNRSDSMPPVITNSSLAVPQRSRSLPKRISDSGCTPTNLNQGNSHQSDVLIMFLSFRLGLDSFNLRYQPFLQSCFGIPQFQGLAGGGSLTSAYWFVAANDEYLYFLDPHSPVQPALREVDRCITTHSTKVQKSIAKSPSTSVSKNNNSASSLAASWPSVSSDRLFCHPTKADGASDLSFACPDSESWTVSPGLKLNNEACSKEMIDQMFFPSAPKQLNWRALNPSMTLVFLCQSFLLFEDLLLRLSEVDSEGLISVAEDPDFTDFNQFNGIRGNEQKKKLSLESTEDGFYLL